MIPQASDSDLALKIRSGFLIALLLLLLLLPIVPVPPLPVYSVISPPPRAFP
jgi:hypothetical protein